MTTKPNNIAKFLELAADPKGATIVNVPVEVVQEVSAHITKQNLRLQEQSTEIEALNKQLDDAKREALSAKDAKPKAKANG